MNHITERYLEVGLPFTVSAEMRKAWEDYLAGRGAPLRLLPTNGDRCTAAAMSVAGCGYPLLIDGSCPNQTGHVAVVEIGWFPEDDEVIAGALVSVGPWIGPGGHCGGGVYGWGGPEGPCALEWDHEGGCEA